jgi:hypothetical protein
VYFLAIVIVVFGFQDQAEETKFGEEETKRQMDESMNEYLPRKVLSTRVTTK